MTQMSACLQVVQEVLHPDAQTRICNLVEVPHMHNNDPIVACLCVLQVVQEVVNPDAKIEYRENTADDPKCRKPDITKVLCDIEPSFSSLAVQLQFLSNFSISLFVSCGPSFDAGRAHGRRGISSKALVPPTCAVSRLSSRKPCRCSSSSQAGVALPWRSPRLGPWEITALPIQQSAAGGGCQKLAFSSR